MNRVDITELHFIAPIANVPSILRHGILSHRQADRLAHDSVAMPEVQERRKNKLIPGARHLHEYANLYFDAHNPMLSMRRAQNDAVCVLRADCAVLDRAGSGQSRVSPALELGLNENVFWSWTLLRPRGYAGQANINHPPENEDVCGVTPRRTMDKEIVVRLHASFEDMVRKHPDTGTEFWCARDLQMLLGYAKWENFAKVVDKAITACQTAGYDPKDHFLGVRKMVDLGSGAKREIDDIALTRQVTYA